MELDKDLQGGESWELPENLLRRIWKIAKLGEWSGWNSKWRARCCPACGGPESYRKHADYCSLARALNAVELLFPTVTQVLPLDPIEEIEAREIEALFFGEIEEHLGEDDQDPDRPFWKN